MGSKKPSVAITPGLPPGVSRIKVKGSLRVYKRASDGQYIASAWPKGHGADSPARAAARAQFKQMVVACKMASGSSQARARQIAAKTTFLPRDILAMAATGRLTFLTYDDGSLWMGWRLADQMIQVLLDSIFNAPGSIIVRGPDYWLALLAGTDGQVLTFDSAQGIPQWKAGTADIQTLLDGISDTPGMGLIRGSSSWEAIDLSGVGDIQTLLNQLSPSSGDGIRFNGSDWVVVDFDGLYDASGSAATAQANAEAYADSLLGGGQISFHPGYATGRWYTTPTASGTAAIAMFTGTLYATPFYVPKQTTFTQVKTRVTGWTSMTKFEAAIYSSVNGAPGALLHSTEITGVSGVGDISATGLSWTLDVGWYWLACSGDGTASIQGNSANGLTTELCGASSVNAVLSGLSVAWTYASNALPVNFGAGAAVSGTTPLIWLAL
jgi:hypothetical protein